VERPPAISGATLASPAAAIDNAMANHATNQALTVDRKDQPAKSCAGSAFALSLNPKALTSDNTSNSTGQQDRTDAGLSLAGGTSKNHKIGAWSVDN